MTDPSASSQALGVFAFAVLVLALLILGAVLRHHYARRAAATTPTTTTARRCTTTACIYPGSILVLLHDDLGGGMDLKCVGCANEGEAHQWWEQIGRVAA